MGVGITSLLLRTWIGSCFLYGPSNITDMHEIRHVWTRNIQVTMALCMLGFPLDITYIHPTQVTLLDITASNCFVTPFPFWGTASGSYWWNNVRVEETGVRKKPKSCQPVDTVFIQEQRRSSIHWCERAYLRNIRCIVLMKTTDVKMITDQRRGYETAYQAMEAGGIKKKETGMQNQDNREIRSWLRRGFSCSYLHVFTRTCSWRGKGIQTFF